MYGGIMILAPNIKNIDGNTCFWLTYVKIINVKAISSNLVDLMKHRYNIVVSSTMIPATSSCPKGVLNFVSIITAR